MKLLFWLATAGWLLSSCAQPEVRESEAFACGGEMTPSGTMLIVCNHNETLLYYMEKVELEKAQQRDM